MASAEAASKEVLSDTDASTIAEPADYQVHRVESRLGRAQSRTGDAEKGEQEGEHQEPARQVRGLKWLLICVAIYISAFLYGLDTTIAADVQGSVIEAFGHVEQLAWVGAGFPMGSVAVILAVGNLYTSFNMKWTYVASIALFELGSTVCGAAPNMSALIVGRVIAGAGGSGIYLGGLNYMSAMTNEKERGTYITGIGFFWGLGAVLGPVIGGSFSTSSATWRWAFYINLVIGAVTAPIFLFSLPSIHPVKGVPVKTRVANLDFLGFVLNAAIWVTFTMALTMAGGQWPWNDGRTIAMFVVFGVLLILYVLQQYFTILTTAETRSFPAHLLKSRTQVLLYIATSANITALFVIVYFIPIYFQFVHSDSALMAAVRLLPFVIITVTFNLLAGYLLSRVRYYMPIYVVSGVLITLGSGLLMGFLDPSTPQANIYGFTVIIAVGTGITVQIGYAIATFKTEPKYIGDAISLQNVSQIGGTVIALVIAGQIFQSTAVKNLTEVLAGQGFSAEDIQQAVAGAQSKLFTELSGELLEQAVLAITQAIQKSFILVIVAGAVLIVASLAMRVERLFGDVVVA